MIIALPAGQYPANTDIEIASNDRVRWIPTQLSDSVRLRLSVVEVYPNVELYRMYVRVEVKDEQENMLNTAELWLSDLTPELTVQTPRGSKIVDIAIVCKVCRTKADVQIIEDEVWTQAPAPTILTLEVLDPNQNVLESAYINHGATVTGCTAYYYATVVSPSPYVEFPISTSGTKDYIMNLIARITNVTGTPSETDYLEFRTLDKYRTVISSCRISSLRAYEECAVVVTGEEAWAQLVLNTQQPGLAVDVEVIERVRGFMA